jgi:hypothetical protein
MDKTQDRGFWQVFTQFVLIVIGSLMFAAVLEALKEVRNPYEMPRATAVAVYEIFNLEYFK